MRFPAAGHSLAALAPVAALLCTALVARHAAAQSLRGSHRSVSRMYHYATSHDLYFYKTSKGVHNAVDRDRFVRLVPNANFDLDEVSFPYVKPMVRTFVRRLASEYRQACGEKMVVTSALRPERWQPPNSSELSVHPTGIAVDLRRPRGRCLRWLRKTLLVLEERGVVEATEEHYPAHFHVAVFVVPYRRYVQRMTGKTVMAGMRKMKYEIQQGDTLWGIARRYGTSVAQLRTVNDLDSGTIFPGQEIVVPRGK